ncbi:hypothetical protein OF83DRAFT_1085136 [Amylostereum chailletii]|nr:hypothetical protein OF83DRAFT_1085136 [Amylostereum chailletii]
MASACKDEDTIIMHYGNEVPFLVVRSKEYKDIIASVRRNIHKTEVQKAHDDDIQITAYHPKYPDKRVQVTKEVWPTFQNFLEEFTVGIRPSGREHDTEKDDKNDDKDEDRSEDEVPGEDKDGSEDKNANSRGLSKKCEWPQRQSDDGMRRLSKKFRPSRNVLPPMTEPKTEPGDFSVSVRIDRESDAVHNKYSGFPMFAQHQEIEREWIQTHTHVHWLVPPPEAVKDIRKYISGDSSVVIDSAVHRWLRDRRCFDSDGKPRCLILPSLGKDLYRAMVIAHKGHSGKDKTWRRLEAHCLGPSHSFVYLWHDTCPTCHQISSSETD